jgi:hypothetical protein
MTPRQASLEDIFVRLVSAEHRPDAEGEPPQAVEATEAPAPTGSEAH